MYGCSIFCFFFNDTATTDIYTYRHTLSLHDALPISPRPWSLPQDGDGAIAARAQHMGEADPGTLHLPRAGFAAQLGDDLHHLAEMRCADRLALADEAAAHVHRMLAGDLGDALVDQAPALADRAHLQFLIYLQLAKGVGVLHLEAIDILRAKPGLLIGLAGGHLGRALIIGGGAHAVGGAAGGRKSVV